MATYDNDNDDDDEDDDGKKRGGMAGWKDPFMACPSENYLPSHLRTQPQRPSSLLCNITVYDTTRFFSSRLMAVMYIVNLAKHSRK